MSRARMPSLLLDLLAHVRLQGSAPKMPTRSFSWSGSTPTSRHGLGQVQGIGGGGQEHGRAEVLHDDDLALGVAAGDRDDRGAEAFGAVVRAEAAGEQAVAVGVVDHVAAGHPGPWPGTGP